MNTKKLFHSLIFLSLIVVLSSFTGKSSYDRKFPGIYPGSPVGYVKESAIFLGNKSLEVKWRLKEQSIHIEEITNKLDGKQVSTNKVILFGLKLAEGPVLTNSDFKLSGKIAVKTIQPTDSMPTAALKFPGKEISGIFINNTHHLSIKWTAQLREGSNYIRQNIEISSLENAVRIENVSFFDGTLNGAEYFGSVLGSPIKCQNFFFGMEHPIAHSKALLNREIGSVSGKSIDISKIINSPGDYVVSIEHGGGPDNYNIESICLKENGQIVSEDKHPLNGKGGSSLYNLNVKDYNPKSTYQIVQSVSNEQIASGKVHIYKKTKNLLNFYVNRADELKPGKQISEWAVIGVSSEGQYRRSVQYYIERERSRPYKQFLHYNCWWDITDDGASSFTSEQLIERMEAWNKKFIQPYKIELQSFVFDDGWDDLNHVWHFDRSKFPEGFAPQALLCKKFNSGIGVWMSPFGGYLENQQRRIESAKREGLETNNKGLSLAGDKYFNRFYERALDMLTNYKVNYFKYDGFGGSEPSYLPDMEAGARLIKQLRKVNPNVYINITVGSWPSPFWLQYADCTWRGSGDLHHAGEGMGTQKFMTYRDGTLHNNIVNRAPAYPLNSIMTAGIAYANLGHPSRYITDNKADFKDMVRTFFAGGSSLQELYISHDKMKPEFWPILAEAAHWAKANEDVLVDTHWIGGSPINLEIYGFASWNGKKGIISLRNPGKETTTYNLNLSETLELQKSESGKFILKSPWKEDSREKGISAYSDKISAITLKPFQSLVLEVIPVK